MKFSRGLQNAKLRKLEKRIRKRIYSFSLLSGHTCPFAKDCHSKVDSLSSDHKRRKLIDGPHTKFRCFSASQEAAFTNTFLSRKLNTDALKYRGMNMRSVVDRIDSALPSNAEVVRIHVAGDFFNQPYFDGWVRIAQIHENKIFYAYTKSLPFWVRRKEKIPQNFILTASYGGYKDEMIGRFGLRYAKVVFSLEEAKNLGLEVDYDDFHAYNPLTRDESFGLLLHGVQPKGSKAAIALKELKK